MSAEHKQGQPLNFSEDSRQVLARAEEEAKRFNHNYIGTEHILLGIFKGEDNDPAKTVLRNLGVKNNKLVRATEFVIGRGDRPTKFDLSLTPRARQVIKFAIEEAETDNASEVDTAHLLKGIRDEGESVAVGVLQRLGVSLEKLSKEITKVKPVQPQAQETTLTPEQELVGRLRTVFENPDISPVGKNLVKELVETAVNIAEKKFLRKDIF